MRDELEGWRLPPAAARVVEPYVSATPNSGKVPRGCHCGDGEYEERDLDEAPAFHPCLVYGRLVVRRGRAKLGCVRGVCENRESIELRFENDQNDRVRR